MAEIFTQLNVWLAGSLLVAALGALLWGIASVVLSPCHLGSMPLLIAFIGGQRTDRRGAAGLSLLFAFGVLLSILVIGLVTTGLGMIAGDLGGWENLLIAALFIVMGLHLLEVLPMPWENLRPGQPRGHGLVAAFLFGLLFGVALGPCTFAYLAPVLAVAFGAADADPLRGLALVGLYGVGHTAVIAAAGICTPTVQQLLRWQEKRKGLTLFKKLAALLLIAAGLYFIVTAR